MKFLDFRDRKTHTHTHKRTAMHGEKAQDPNILRWNVTKG